MQNSRQQKNLDGCYLCVTPVPRFGSANPFKNRMETPGFADR